MIFCDYNCIIETSMRQGEEKRREEKTREEE
jgi:hypothetical protein